MKELKDLKASLMEDLQFREDFALIEALVRTCAAENLTRAKLASRLGTIQSGVARLEGGWVSPSFAVLRRYAEATEMRLTVDLAPAQRKLPRGSRARPEHCKGAPEQPSTKLISR